MTSETETPQYSRWQAWLLAIRPKTLPAATSGVIAGTAVAFADGGFRLLPALALMLAALLLQIGANVTNDYFDFYKGADTKERLGPLRVTQAGLLPPGEVVAGMVVIFGLAALLGVYLIIVSGWPILLIGVLAILAALAYTGGPFPLGYHGLGELFVFLFFGLAAVCGTYYAQTLRLSFSAVLASLPIGLLTMNILAVNNLRDIETDRASGKHTLAVRIGEKGTVREYGIFLALAYLVVLGGAISGAITPSVMLTWISVPLAFDLFGQVSNLRGRPLNKTLALTGQLDLLFSALYSLGLVLTRLFG